MTYMTHRTSVKATIPRHQTAGDPAGAGLMFATSHLIYHHFINSNVGIFVDFF